MMAAATATPLRFFDPVGQIPSGEALRADEAPLAEKIQDRQTWLGDTWRDVLVFAMRVAGRPVQTVDVRWRPVQVVDDLEGWQTVKAKIEAGVPTRSALMDAGYRPEVVDEWDQGSDQTNLETRLAALERLSKTALSFTSAMNLGEGQLDVAPINALIQQTAESMFQDEPRGD